MPCRPVNGRASDLGGIAPCSILPTGSGKSLCIRVVALVERRRGDSSPEYQERLRSERWYVPVVEVRYRHEQAAPQTSPPSLTTAWPPSGPAT